MFWLLKDIRWYKSEVISEYNRLTIIHIELRSGAPLEESWVHFLY